MCFSFTDRVCFPYPQHSLHLWPMICETAISIVRVQIIHCGIWRDYACRCHLAGKVLDTRGVENWLLEIRCQNIQGFWLFSAIIGEGACCCNVGQGRSWHNAGHYPKAKPCLPNLESCLVSSPSVKWENHRWLFTVWLIFRLEVVSFLIVTKLKTDSIFMTCLYDCIEQIKRCIPNA